MSEPDPSSPTLFQQIGGEPAIAKLVDVFYHLMDTDPLAQGIRHMHGDDLGPINAVLRDYLGEWLGGPKAYSQVRGHPRLRMRHMPFKIGLAERDAWLHCMNSALDQTIADEAARQEIRVGLTKLADWMRNQPPLPQMST